MRPALQDRRIPVVSLCKKRNLRLPALPPIFLDIFRPLSYLCILNLEPLDQFHPGNMAKKEKSTGKSLVIVESPAKAKTINHYLGPDYEVKASMGHVRDLPSKGLSVDIEHDFEPTYEISPGKKDGDIAEGGGQEVRQALSGDRP